MAQHELHSDTMPIEQKSAISDDPRAYQGDVVTGDNIRKIILSPEYIAELAFMQEPVTIRLEPSSDKNAAGAFPVWVNGKPAEVFQNGRWNEIGYLPVSRELTVRRSVLEVIIRAKVDTVHTKILEEHSERPNNVVQRFTSPVHSFSILEDKNPRGAAWVQELRRRNL